MTCEKAEELLSAYLDDALDPSLRSDVEAHLATCERCRQTLAEYRRLDRALISMPRLAPADALRARIFESPEFAALVRDLEREERAGDRPGRRAPSAGSRSHPRASSPPRWSRVALPSAAAIALLLGSALLVKQGLFHSDATVAQAPTHTIYNAPAGGPLAAGPRVVYARDGALWSAPENGSDIARQLTPDGARVAGWSVSPDGKRIAYVDRRDGSLHVVQSDDQRDARLASVAPGGMTQAAYWASPVGRAVAQGIAWSPDGAQIAYIAALDATHTTLHVIASDGSHDRALTGGSAPALASAPLWSADGARLAYLQTAGGAQNLWVADPAGGSARELAVAADPAAPQATFGRVAWAGAAQQPTLTWTAQDGATITGVFASSPDGAGGPHALTPAGQRYVAADFTPARDGGAWVVAAQGGALSILPAGVSSPQAARQIGVFSSPVDALRWSPNGQFVAITGAGGSAIWSAEQGLVALPAGASATGAPAWSPDGVRLAMPTTTGVTLYTLTNGQPHVSATLLTLPEARAVRWATDGQGFAIASATGVTLVGADGAVERLADPHGADGALLVWSSAG